MKQLLTNALQSFLLDMIHHHPEVEQKIFQEVDTILADKEEPTIQDLNKLPYITMVLKETLRMYPPGRKLKTLFIYHLNTFAYFSYFYQRRSLEV
jgi:hypothetical protein